jgi:hypothetical protein
MRAARRKVAKGDDGVKENPNCVVVEQEDLIAAAAAAVPSLSLDDLERFDKLHSSFSVGGGGT